MLKQKKQTNKTFSSSLWQQFIVIEIWPVPFFSDLRKIYNSFRDSPLTPKMLQQKVQFDIRFFFSKSRGDTGSEHMHAMTKDYFQKIMCNGEKIIVKSSELEKNNGIFQKEIYSGYIPEVRGWELCPVRSFEFYLTVLHPGCDSLWQRPRNDRPRFESEHWYVFLHLKYHMQWFRGGCSYYSHSTMKLLTVRCSIFNTYCTVTSKTGKTFT